MTPGTAHVTPYIAGAATAELEDWGPLEEATGPEMATSGVEVWVDSDASRDIWQCASGPSYWTLETHEVIHLVAGRMTSTPDGGEPTEIGAGDMAVFPKGWSGTWEIHETVRGGVSRLGETNAYLGPPRRTTGGLRSTS